MRIALAGDTMLGRGVAEQLGQAPAESLFAPDLVEIALEADLLIVNLECCISERGRRAPGRVFHFRAPPAAAQALAHLGVDCVTLANNHALDYRADALLDTLDHLERVGIRWVGAGPDLDAARRPAVLESAGERLRVIACSDHPVEYAAGADRPGIAFAELERDEEPEWLVAAVRESPEPVLVCPHWGPNMVTEPVAHVRRAAALLEDAGASLVAGHSAHVFHGVAGRTLFDLGDFIDDYRVDPKLRNDLGLLWFVDLADGVPVRLEAVPLALDFCHTRIAGGAEREWVTRRLIAACGALGTEARDEGGRLVVGHGQR